jgi:SAM-dependent methyltransferase
VFNFNKYFRVGYTNLEDRDKWIEEALAKIPKGKRILDAGAGECPYKPFCSHLDYVSQDFSQYHGTGDVGMHTGTFDVSRIDIVSDITNIPVDDASFDAVLCSEVLEHVPYPIKALEELARVLKPGGQLILTAPFISYTHFAPYHFHTGFSRFFYEFHLPKLNFEINEMTPNGNFFEVTAQEVRRIKRVAATYNSRKAGWIDRILVHLLLIRLNRLSKTGKKSAELACYGFHVIAQKK